MEVIIVENERKVKFSEVTAGQAFFDEYSNLFIKFAPTCDAEDADNAVNLKSGYGCMFDDNESVVIAPAKVVLMDRG